MTAYRPGIDPDRRRGPDFWFKSLRWFAVGSWLIMFLALIFFAIAKPEETTFFDRQFNVKRESASNLTLISVIFYFMITGFCLSITGFFINLKRLRRKNDEFRISLILVGLISFGGILLYLFVF